MVSESELLKRTKKEISLVFLIVFILGTPLGLWMAYNGTIALINQSRHNHLLESGVKTEGTVIAKDEGRFFEVILRYTTLEGKEVEAICTHLVKREQFEEISIGDTVSLWYDPQNPQAVTILPVPTRAWWFEIIISYIIAFFMLSSCWLTRFFYIKDKLYLYKHGIESTGIVKRCGSMFGLHQIIFEVEGKRRYREYDYFFGEDFKYMSVGRTIKILVHPDPKKRRTLLRKNAIYLPDWFSRQASQSQIANTESNLNNQQNP